MRCVLLGGGGGSEKVGAPYIIRGEHRMCSPSFAFLGVHYVAVFYDPR